MKKAITVTIKTPCSEKWESFTPVRQGGFCQQCNKTVVDLTRLSDRELLEFLRSRTSSTCARMRPDQVGRHELPLPARIVPGFKLFKAAAATLILMLVARQGQSQTGTITTSGIGGIEALLTRAESQLSTIEKGIIVSGKVVDESGFPLPGVAIILPASQTGTVSDSEGRFTFPEPVQQGQSLLFMFIGYSTQEFKVRGSDDVDMVINMTMDVEIMGELLIDQPYAVKPEKSLWSKIKQWF